MNEQWLAQHVEMDDKIQAGTEILEIQKELMRLTEKKRLDETIFVQVFLPVFEGIPMEQRKYKVDLANWTNYAGDHTQGGPFMEVDVIDKLGNVLFTVPPVFDRAAITPSRKDQRGGSILNMIQTTQRLARLSPYQAKHYLRTEMNHRAVSMAKMDNVMMYLKQWNDIFKRYGRPAILELLDEATTTEKSQQDDEKRKLDDADWELL